MTVTLTHPRPKSAPSPGLYGSVVKTVCTREEAEKGSGAHLRVIQVTRDLKPGHRVSAGDVVAELVRGLPPRGR